MIWDAANECLLRPELEALQLSRLKESAARAYGCVPFYKESLDRAGVSPDRIRSLDDLRRLPFIQKQDFRAAYPFGLLAVAREDLRELHASSGTTGAISLTAYTQRDLDTWAELVARVFGCAGVRPHALVHNAYGYGLFTGGLGFHYGARRYGCTVLPISGGNAGRQVRLMKDLRPDVLCCTPSYALHLAEAWREAGFADEDLSARVGIFGAEPWSEGLRREIQVQLHLDAVDIYGLAEAIGPGVSCECVEERSGLHVFEDHFIVECLDPQSGEPVPEGERGELVFTSLTKEALPIIRYRTGDLSSLSSEPCRCGRTMRRMARITGRTDDMLVIRGMNVFPSDVETVLMEIPALAPQYRLIVDRDRSLDTIELQVEAREGHDIANLDEQISTQLRNALGVAMRVTVVPGRAIPRSEGKALRVVDRRTL